MLPLLPPTSDIQPDNHEIIYILGRILLLLFIYAQLGT